MRADIQIKFELPDWQPAPINVTPSPYAGQPAYLSKPALAPPQPRVHTEFGAVLEKPREGTDWMNDR
jgi:hypothetical protein